MGYYDPTDPTQGDPTDFGTKYDSTNSRRQKAREYKEKLALGVGVTALIGTGLGISKTKSKPTDPNTIDMSEFGVDNIKTPDLSEISKLPGKNVTSEFTNNALPAEFKGIKIIQHHGELKGQEAADFMGRLGHLTDNYPNLSDLKEIHINHSPKRLRGKLGIMEKMVPMPEGGVVSAFAWQSQGKLFNGGIYLNAPRINQLSGNNVATGFRADSGILGDLTHEFGHHVEFDLARQNDPSKLDFKAVDYQSHGLTPESIGSKYAAFNDREMFAETFSRAHTEGPGFENAKRWESGIRTARNRVSRSEKMAHHARFAEEQLRHM